MSATSDSDVRLRALTELNSSFVVEAGAGTGKTSLLAGRIALLLASGVRPRAIAAITFTELAAGELAARVRLFVQGLLAGETPDVLQVALATGLSQEGRANLAAAETGLDELTTSTIHEFCRSILRDHAIIARIDPGAKVIDAAAADAAFDTVFDRWLERRLDGSAVSGGPVASLARHDPRGVAEMLRGLARFKRAHLGATAVPSDLTGRPDLELAEAVDAFRRWIAGVDAPASATARVDALETIATFYQDAFAAPPGFDDLWRLAHPPRVAPMPKESYEMPPLKGRSAWEAAAGAEEGSRLWIEASRLCDAAQHRFAALLGLVATAVVAALSEEMDELLGEYATFKLAAAVVDFDDLIERTRALLRDDRGICIAVSDAYRHILVDEFQDTDPAQAEIVFRLTAEDAAPSWPDCRPRPGALFIVGDPKQAIYGFRGADTRAYEAAKAVLLRHWPRNLIEVTANWRSRPAIADHVNSCFAGPLSPLSQSGYAPMQSTRGHPRHTAPCVSKLPLRLPPDANAAHVRDVEAEAVAELCSRLVGSLEIEDQDGARRLLTAGDIALLSPTGTDLWRYQRALNSRGLHVASQAGKAFYRRQEVHDLMALTRVLADPYDTLAFGALMRGPLVGLSDEALLDVAQSLFERHGEATQTRFTGSTPPDEIPDHAARGVVALIQGLHAKASSTSPFQALSAAVAVLDVRTIVAERDRYGAAAALANVDAFLDLARTYAVHGLRRLAQDLDAAWRAGRNREEGRIDAEGTAIEIITVHKAKGLEWPVVVPINTGTRLARREPFIYRASDNTIHWMIGDVVAPNLADAVHEAQEAQSRENERLWYVAATRAREMVIIPEVTCAVDRSWARVVDLGHATLPELDKTFFTKPVGHEARPTVNMQDHPTFEAEGARVVARTPAFRWIRPSDRDDDRIEDIGAETDIVGRPVGSETAGAGRVRGLVLHKLIEEILAKELGEDPAVLARRADTLLHDLTDGTPDDGQPLASELAQTVLATLSLPDIAVMRTGLVPEYAVHAFIDRDGDARPVDGRADAVFIGPHGIQVVLDWKSDVAPSAAARNAHRDQMLTYMQATSAKRGAIVYMTNGAVTWLGMRDAS